MIGSFFFICNRLVEIIFLIPIIGMLVRLTYQTHPPQLSGCTGMSLDSNMKAGLLYRRISQGQCDHPDLHPRAFHRQHYRRLLVL